MKSYFDQEIGLVPPTNIDIDRTMSRQRRLGTYRRIGYSVGGSVAALAAVVAMVSVTPGNSGAADNNQAGASVTATATAIQSPGTATSSKGALVPTEDPAKAAIRLSEALKAAVEQQTAGFTMKATGDTKQLYGFTHHRTWVLPKESPVDKSPGVTYNSNPTTKPDQAGEEVQVDGYVSTFSMTDSKGTGNVRVSMYNTKATDEKCSTRQVTPDLFTCERATTADGSVIIKNIMVVKLVNGVVTSYTGSALPQDGSWAITYEVTIIKPDHTAITLTTANSEIKYADRISRPLPALTVDQIVKIISDSKLTLFP